MLRRRKARAEGLEGGRRLRWILIFGEVDVVVMRDRGLQPESEESVSLVVSSRTNALLLLQSTASSEKLLNVR